MWKTNVLLNKSEDNKNNKILITIHAAFYEKLYFFPCFLAAHGDGVERTLYLHKGSPWFPLSSLVWNNGLNLDQSITDAFEGGKQLHLKEKR